MCLTHKRVKLPPPSLRPNEYVRITKRTSHIESYYEPDIHVRIQHLTTRENEEQHHRTRAQTADVTFGLSARRRHATCCVCVPVNYEVRTRLSIDDDDDDGEKWKIGSDLFMGWEAEGWKSPF